MHGFRLVLCAVVLLALCLPGCSRALLQASEIKPAVDLVVADYVTLVPDSDPLKPKKIALANELKATVDLAAEGGE